MGKKLKNLLTVDEIFILQESGVYLQDTVALFYDLKPLLRAGVSHWKFEAFKEALSKLGFKLLTMEPRGPNKENFNCIISKSEKKLKEYHKAEENMEMGRSDDSLGKLFGYPRCCVEEFTKNTSMNKSLPPMTLLNTKGGLDFRLNYLYSFDSRQFNYEEFNRVTKGYLLSNNYLIPYIPCSFNCKESINYAQKLLDILKLEFPEYYERLTSFLKKPILFYSDFVFFPLNGKMEGDTLSYQGFLKIHNRLPAEIVKLLNKGSLIKRKNNCLQIYQGNRCIDELPLSVKLFNFE